MVRIGDEVRVKDWDEMLEIPGAEECEDRGGKYIYSSWNGFLFTEDMKGICGEIVEISEFRQNGFIVEGYDDFYLCEKMVEKL